MNKGVGNPPQPESGQYRSLQILDELANNDALTQRDLSQRLGIALGLVNSYIKNLVAKGFITVTAIPPKRYAYYLTPKGLAEKTRLAYDLLADYTRIYREARDNLKKLFHGMERQGMRTVVFAGADEVAEIAYLTLQETSLKLIGVVDDEKAGGQFFGTEIQPLSAAARLGGDSIVLTSYVKRNAIYRELLRTGVPESAVKVLFTITPE
jgi:DNA-binding MarR family transcriptional regulator